MLVDLGRENGAKLAPKWDQKSMLTSKGRFYKSTYKTNRILMIFEVRGVEKSIKNRSKIDQKMESKMECLLASIFDRFLINFGRFWEASWDAKSIKNRLKKASKNRCQKKGEYEASWRHLGPSWWFWEVWVGGWVHGGGWISGPLIIVNRGFWGN